MPDGRAGGRINGMTDNYISQLEELGLVGPYLLLEAERNRYRRALEEIVKVNAPKVDLGKLMALIAQEALDA